MLAKNRKQLAKSAEGFSHYIYGKDLVEYCHNYLDSFCVKGSLLNIEYILRELLNCSRYDLYTGKFVLEEKDYAILKKWLNRLSKNEPVQYITNVAYFMDFEFYIDHRTLIPRQETELLVKKVIDYADSKELIGLDLGTGCGNIAISIANYLSKVQMIASDFSKDSIEVANININKYNVSNRVELKYGGMFSPIIDMNNKLDFIVSNPPYISETEMQNLPSEVYYEPRIAFEAGAQGLDFYKKIINEADEYLKLGGHIFLEVGKGQIPSICEYLSTNKNLKFKKSVSDYNRVNRILVVSKTNKNGHS